MNKPLIFSDIDGTFLTDKYDISFSDEFLKKVSGLYNIVFVSSRTADEIIYLLKKLNWQNDFIAENGSIIGLKSQPAASESSMVCVADSGYSILCIGTEISAFRQTVEAILSDYSAEIEIFNDLSPQRIAELSDYDLASAHRAINRKATLLLRIAQQSDVILDELSSKMLNNGLRIIYGGRWFSVSSGLNKGEAILKYLKLINYSGETAGIGNSNNDFELLKACDLQFIINEHGYNKKLKTLPNAVRLTANGTAGWEEMINRLQA